MEVDGVLMVASIKQLTNKAVYIYELCGKHTNPLSRELFMIPY